jgi:methylenetetrahydrofolate reductase (NADPH)
MTNAIEISFEFSPPRTAEMEASLWRAIRSLAPLRPRFVSVTYGAGGSTRERTHATVQRILHETDIEPAAHLTCVEASRAEVNAVVQAYRAIGVRHIVALRGDPPEGSARFTPHPGGYRNAEELVRGIRAIADFEISVAAYPEVHPEALSPQADLDNLKRKLDAGASRAITQFFFDPEVYLRFVDRARVAGIGAPIVPGILPVTNFKRVREFAHKCGASVPHWLAELFDGLDDDPTTRNLVAAWVAAEQCRKLQEHGVREFHFYTLNRAELTRSICHILGVRPGPAADAAPKAAAG